jgi:hypothetical protein
MYFPACGMQYQSKHAQEIIRQEENKICFFIDDVLHTNYAKNVKLFLEFYALNS